MHLRNRYFLADWPRNKFGNVIISAVPAHHLAGLSFAGQLPNESPSLQITPAALSEQLIAALLSFP